MTREEAIEIYKGLINPNIIEAFEALVPELKEIGYDMMREQIIRGFENWKSNGNLTFNNLRVDDILVWLEKQKEQKEIPLMNGDADLYFDEWNLQQQNPTKRQCFEEGMRYAQRLQKEQKPIQSEEEKEYVRTLKALVSDFIRNSGGGITDVSYYQQLCDWLDGRHIEQKPAEWSEEDEKFAYFVNQFLGYHENADPTAKSCKKWFNNRLKSLRPSWKPNDEDEVRLINTSISFLKDFADKGYENAVECIDWLKSKLNGNTCK